jgi:hypothetical protein
MTTTPREPLEDPDVTPSGDPGAAPEPVGPAPVPPEPVDPDVEPGTPRDPRTRTDP